MTELSYPSGLAARAGFVGLRAMREHLQPLQCYGYRELSIGGLSFHSTEVEPGHAFFAVPGTREDGARYARDAVARGAVAVVSTTPIDVPCPVLIVEDVRRALADAAGFFYGHPSRSLKTVGITGTNGKTTVGYLVRHCLEADQRSVGLLGTVGYEFGGRRLPASTTTPDPVRLHGYLREMVDRGTNAAVMEVSSHALMQHRVRGVEFDVGVFTNLSQDHLDYHADMLDYARAKARLFEMLEPGSTAVLGLDSPYVDMMWNGLDTGVNVRTFGCSRDAEIRAENLSCTVEGTRFEMVMPNGRVDLLLRLIGKHNVQNALAAAGVALSLGVSELTIASALEDVRPVRGRLELVGYRRGVRTFVDYAHTPDAMDKACGTLAELTQGKLITVFGCGGDRDRAKRPQMAQAAAKHVDLAILTSDNPRSEDPEAILDEVEAGFGGRSECAFERVPDRADAIREALRVAGPGDTVLIAGKGHETFQILRDSIVPFDDRLVAREAMQSAEG